MARTGYTEKQKIKIIDYVIAERYKSNRSIKDLCRDCNIATVTLYNWLKSKELLPYKEKLNEAVNYMELQDTTSIKLGAKSGLEFLVKKSKQKKVTKFYDYVDIKDDDGEVIRTDKVLKSEKTELIDIPPDPKVVMFAMSKLFPQFEEGNKMEAMLENFMEFNEFLKNVDPQLAKKFVVYQNNYMAKKIKDIEYEEVKNNDDE